MLERTPAINEFDTKVIKVGAKKQDKSWFKKLTTFTDSMGLTDLSGYKLKDKSFFFYIEFDNHEGESEEHILFEHG